MEYKNQTCPHCSKLYDIDIDPIVHTFFCPHCSKPITRSDLDHNSSDFAPEYINKKVVVNKHITNFNTYEQHCPEAEIIRAKNEAEKDKRDTKSFLICICILLSISLLIGGWFFFNSFINESQGKISAGYYRDLLGKDYKTVEAHFRAAGFTNIETIDLNDAGLFVWDDGKVSHISIGGNADFDSTSYFFPYTKVVISHH